MNNKLIKEKRKHYIKIMSIILVVCFVIAGAYSFIVYNYEEEKLYNSAESDCSDFFENIAFMTYDNYLYYEINSLEDNVQVKVEDEKKNVIAETGNYFPVDFTDKKREQIWGYIDFEKFKNSMSQKQYKKITDCLNSKPGKIYGELEGDLYYQLLCMDYYLIGSEVIPKTVDLVVTCEDNTWYVQDEVAQRFELKVDLPEDKKVLEYKSGEMHRNVIDNDFVLNKYEKKDILGEIGDISYIYGDNLKKTGPFSYIYYRTESLYKSGSQQVVRGIKDGNVYTLTLYTVRYAEEYNVLLSCIGNIIIAVTVIFVFFITLGVLLGFVTWHTVKNRIEQENKRIYLTNVVAHDLKTPLFVISGYAEILKENIFTEKSTYYADVILDQTKQMNSLVHRMLDLSKFDSLNFKLIKENFSLTDLISNVLSKYPDAQGYDKIKFESDNNYEIYGDKKLLKSAVENLIDNAIKYSAKGKPVKINLKGNKFSILNSIESPITKEELKQIWEPYTQLDSSRQSKGNGLGLSIVKNVLELHNFRYGVESKDNIIEFWFKI